jgi:hypothetical protein
MSFYHIAFAFLFDQNKLGYKKYLIKLEEE